MSRHPDCDIVLPSLSVSRRHTRLRPEPGGFVLEDLGSLNGVYVNGRPIDAATLADGEEITIGLLRLVFHAGGPIDAAPS